MFYLYLIFIFIFGLIIGSFLNCLIWRLRTEEWVTGRSYCPECKKEIKWYDNIPVLSFLLLRGKCRFCGKSISFQYPAVELVTALLFTLSFYLNFNGSEVNSIILLRDLFIISVMVVVFVYDLKWYLILDKVMFPSIFAVLILNILSGVSWPVILVSAIIGLGFFLLQFLVSGGAWIGGGDIRLGLFMGVALANWKILLFAIFVSYMIGSVIGVGLIVLKRKEWGSKVPLGIFLATGTLIAVFWGEGIVNWYLNLF